MTTATDDVIRAAGGIVTRTGEDGTLQVLVVHRTRHGRDWTLPKGKVEPGETHREAAVREVREETGWTVEVGRFAGAIGYEVQGRPKVVQYWCMSPTGAGQPADRGEVIEVAWLPVPRAIERLTYRAEQQLLASALPGRTTEPRASRSPFVGGFVDTMRWMFLSGRARSRLSSACTTVEIELKEAATDDTQPWVGTARALLSAAQQRLEENDFEAGWRCLHGAERALVRGLPESGRVLRANQLREEARSKLHGWRADAVKKALGDADAKPAPSAEAVVAAMELVHGASENEYHRIGVMADQLGILFWATFLAPALLLLLVACLEEHCCRRSYQFVEVMAVGVLGGFFSAVQSIFSWGPSARIPERVSNQWVTMNRALSGGVAGFAGYLFLSSGLLNLRLGNEGQDDGMLAAAFVFGYAGERLISGIADGIGARSGGNGTPPSAPTGTGTATAGSDPAPKGD